MEQELPKPLVSDEEIELCADQYHAGQGRLSDDNEGGIYSYRADGVSIGLRHARTIYEAELLALRKKMADMEGAGSGDSLEMMANELMRGINEVEVGNQAQAAALLRVLRMRMMKAASLNPKEQR